tara:strand:- start:122 stop:976 length:855 start_codon:yes stop_codon:yes gene_type:complete
MSNLRGKIPTPDEKRLKLLLYGPAGSGKTTASINFPRPYVIDTEAGCQNDQYVRKVEDRGGAIFSTIEFDDIMSEVMALTEEEHPYKTLVIDPISTVYKVLVDRMEMKVGDEYGKHYGAANKKFEQLSAALVRLDMNVICTCHAKNQYGTGMSLIGNTFDGPKKFDYLFDMVMEIQVRGEQRFAMPIKSRVETIKQNVGFEFSYESFAEAYGRDVLERDVKPVALVNAERLAVWEGLLAKLKDRGPLFREKIMTKFKVGDLSEASADVAERSIEKLQAILESEK